MRRVHAIAQDEKQYEVLARELVKGICLGVPVSVPPIAFELLEPLHLFVDVEDEDYPRLRHELFSELGVPFIEDQELEDGPVTVGTLEAAATVVRALGVVVAKGTPIEVDTGKGSVDVEAAALVVELEASEAGALGTRRA